MARRKKAIADPVRERLLELIDVETELAREHWSIAQDIADLLNAIDKSTTVVLDGNVVRGLFPEEKK